jgi:hypothetical protein
VQKATGTAAAVLNVSNPSLSNLVSYARIAIQIRGFSPEPAQICMRVRNKIA